MMRFKMFPGGEILSGDTFLDIVRAMADQKMEPVRDLAGYRTRTAERVKELFEREIRTETNKRFVEDLVEHRLLERM